MTGISARVSARVLARRPDVAGRQALKLYGHAPPTARAHVAIRWVSCPFPAVAALVPRTGRVLEVGCGHGLFAAYLALQSGDRDVTGVDVDAGKIAVASRAAARARRAGAALEVAVAPSGRVPDGPWDAIVIVDVLYLLEPDAQRALLANCRAQLGPAGVLVVKEMGTEPRWKARWNLLQETLSVRVLGITEGNGLTFVPPATTAQWLQDLGLDVRARRLDRGRLHPHHVLVAAPAAHA